MIIHGYIYRWLYTVRGYTITVKPINHSTTLYMYLVLLYDDGQRVVASGANLFHLFLVLGLHLLKPLLLLPQGQRLLLQLLLQVLSRSEKGLVVLGVSVSECECVCVSVNECVCVCVSE